VNPAAVESPDPAPMMTASASANAAQHLGISRIDDRISIESGDIALPDPEGKSPHPSDTEADLPAAAH